MGPRLTPINIIVAMDSRGGIGKNGKLPWKLPKDMAYFHKLTTTTVDPKKINAVLMGRKNWESIPSKFRPLKGRINVVLSRKLQDVAEENVIVARSYEDALEKLDKMGDKLEIIWNIGGHDVYKLGLESPRLEKLFITFVEGDFGADVFFPSLDFAKFRKEEENPPLEVENGISYRFERFIRVKS
ncbi:unnamed protein product [Enterobius vermicularis]|uniref:dihydrofolate reductase n=1 Tax=Enterobius vermicularis TaxID=51028 RepID=A0A0N4VR51_ENTVE|nr:unnamed protein product [Enterobius vermicularis]